MDVFAWNIQYPYFVLLPTFRNFAVKKGALTPSRNKKQINLFCSSLDFM